MSKIIVGVDESDRSRDAVALAALLARGSDAELVLVCAYPYDDVPGRGANTGYRQYLREDAEAAIDRATAGMGELPPHAEAPDRRGVPGQGRSRSGGPTRARR